MANHDQLVAQVSQQLLEELTEGGTRDFTQTRLSQMEEEVYGLSDRISGRLLQGMLEDQSQQTEEDSVYTTYVQGLLCYSTE